MTNQRLSSACVRAFEQNANQSPRNTAIIDCERRVSYAELNRYANCIARFIADIGVKADDRVALFLPRSTDLIASMYAVLKAGAAFVPVDPCYPPQRLQAMLDDAAVTLVIADAALPPGVDCASTPILRLDQQRDAVLQLDSSPLPDRASGSDLAYVIYTSGSTGRPKGVMIERDAMDCFVQAITSAYTLTDQDRVLQFASPSFDVAIEEIFPTLACGATLVLRDDAMISSVDAFLRRSNSLELTVWDLPTAYWHLIAAALEQGGMTLPQSLRLVVIGGEQANAASVRQWQQAVGLTPQLINAYGPTETTVEASVYPVKHMLGQNERLPLGAPLGETQFYILNEDLTSVVDGDIGELFVGGKRLARGYLNRPELTAAAFIADPFSSEPGARLYRTGDLVRRRDDGEIEFQGRRDDQVKIQGFRVELGDIEAALVAHPALVEAAVVAREDQPGDKRLVAYVVTADGQAWPDATSAIQTYLKSQLPHYMVPHAVMLLPTLPRTASDKVDRRNLPAPVWVAPVQGDDWIAPRTQTERKLAAIWESTLNITPIGAHDDFFVLGGHSLMAVQILWKVQQVFGCEAQFRDLLENPRLDQFAARLDQLQVATPDPEQPVLTRVSRDTPQPASFAQERVQFMETLAPSMTAYQFQESLRWTGPLDVPTLERVLSEIIRRHEIFRTTFEMIDGRLMQRVQAPYTVSLSCVDLRSLAVEARDAELQRLRQHVVQQAFDVSALPLLRWLLVRLDDEVHELVHVEHHMVHDGWSFNIFLRELLTLYRCFSAGDASPLAEPPQFVDFAVWQRLWAKSKAAKQQLAYWANKLTGAPPLLELPYDRPRPPEQSFRGGMERMELPLALCHRLRRFDASQKVTLFQSMYAVFLILMQRYSGQTDLCVGTGVANRRLAAIADMIGMVVNNVVLRNDLSGNPRFVDLLRQVRETTLQAYAHEDLPFDDVVDAIKPARQLSYNPLFQVMFSFHDAQLPDLAQIPGVQLAQHESINNRSAKFDLDVVVIPRTEQRLGQGQTQHQVTELTDGITIVWEYAADLFDAASIRTMMAAYQTLLEQVLDAPEQRIDSLELLNAPQKQQLLNTWNRPVAEPVASNAEVCSLHGLIEAQVRQTPSAHAVIARDEQLSYAELDARANQLAHHLRSLGVVPDQPVAITVERSAAGLIAMLGVLKAGGGYVPLDPTYPAERLKHMLHDCGARVWVGFSTQAVMDAPDGVQRLELDQLAATLQAYPTTAPRVDVRAEHLAYVIYTSGSTGLPKGVMIEHRNAVGFIRAAIASYAFNAQDRVLQFASPSFDAAVEEIFGTLSTGARLVLRPDSALDAVADLVAFSDAQGLTVWDLPTAYWHLLVHELHEGRIQLPKSLRLVILGGERALPARIRQWLDHTGTTPKLLNSYGPTEATVVATVADLTAPGAMLDGREAPIGRPLAHTQVMVLDARGQLVPVGLPGELYLGGVGIARGYLGRPDLSAERFVPSPLAERADTRLYRTGDLVRWRPDGLLEFLGRNDNQVKIRGLRIELGEIESVLTGLPDVAQAAVIAREDTPGAKRLVAYVCAQGATTLQIDALRRALAAKLPAYMVPAAFVVLPSLPLTPNGKLDARALPAPGQDAPTSLHGEPRNPIETELCTIWQRVLGLPAVGIHDNFFELGGDSIISIQMISQARQAGLRLTAKQVFQNQTVAQLAAVAVIEPAPGAVANQERVHGDAPLTPIQHWFFEQDLPNPHHFNQSAWMLLPEGTDTSVLTLALQALVEHHDALRLRFEQRDGQWRQSHRDDGRALAVQVHELAASTDAQRRSELAALDAQAQTQLDITHGPLLRAVVVPPVAGLAGYLVLVIHHLVVDAVSWRILREDLARLYAAQLQGKAPDLPARTSAFQTWGQKLVEHAQSAGLRRELDLWAPVQTPVVADLPVDQPMTAASMALSHTTYETRYLDADSTRALLQDVPSAYNTRINDVLLAALAMSLQRWTGEALVQIDLEGHGREDLFDDVDLSRSVGWFTSMYPVVLRAIPGAPGDTLKSIKEQLRAVPARGLGYGVLRYLATDTSTRERMAKTASTQISFNYLGRFDQVTGTGAGTADGGELLSIVDWKSDASSAGQRSHVLAVSGLVADDKLEIRWDYSRALHTSATMAALADDYMQQLRALIDHCTSATARSYTPSDFSAAKLGQKQLDKLVSKLRRRA